MDDKTALAEIRKGGQTGLAHFYKEYQRDLLKYLCLGLKSGKTRLLPLPLDWAEDIVQNTFIKFAQDIQRFEGNCSVFTWLCHQAYYEARSYLRAESKYVTASQLLSSEEAELESPTFTPPQQIYDFKRKIYYTKIIHHYEREQSILRASEDFERWSREQEIEQLLKQLAIKYPTSECSMVIQLVLQGYTIEEIAEDREEFYRGTSVTA